MSRRNPKSQRKVETQKVEAESKPLPCQDMTKFVEQLKEIETTNSGKAHNEADGIIMNALTELGYAELVEAWREVSKKSGGFHYV
jgi:hypothetical protein